MISFVTLLPAPTLGDQKMEFLGEGGFMSLLTKFFPSTAVIMTISCHLTATNVGSRVIHRYMGLC